MVNALVFERRVEVDGLDALELAVADDDAALRALLWRPSDLGDHDIQLRTERAGEPAVGVDVLPVARAPGVVAQAISVDLGCLAVDGDSAGHVHVLLVVRAAEASLGAGIGALVIGLAVDGRDGFVQHVDGDLLVRVLAEGLAGVGHLLRVFQGDGVALVGSPQLDQRLDGLELHATGVEGVIGLDLRALPVEQHGAVGLVERERYFGILLVRAVADAQEAAEPPGVVEEVEIHALVEVLLGAERVGVVVFGLDVAVNGSGNHGCLLAVCGVIVAPVLAAAVVAPLVLREPQGERNGEAFQGEGGPL